MKPSEFKPFKTHIDSDRQPIPRMPPLSGPVQRPHFHQILQVPGCGRTRGAGDGDVVFG